MINEEIEIIIITVARRTFSWGFDHQRILWRDLWNQTGLHHQTSTHDPLYYSSSRILKARDHQSLCYCWLNRTWRRQLHHSLLSCWCMRFPGDILFDSPFDIPKPPLWFSSDACDFWEREREREHRKRRHAIFFPFWFFLEELKMKNLFWKIQFEKMRINFLTAKLETFLAPLEI